MATSMKRLPVRASAMLRSVIDQAGPVGAATRALLWLGADAAGLPISAAGWREIAALIAEEDLASSVVTALQRLYDQLGNGSGARETAPATTRAAALPFAPPLEAGASEERGAPVQRSNGMDDPFADVGMEFGG
jgi:hypothetical protein